MSSIKQNIDNVSDYNDSVKFCENDYISKSERKEYIKKQYDPLSKGYCYNPLTKTPYPYRVNSKEAKDAKLWSVMYSTGQDKEPLKYYFDNKEQYERYRNSKYRRD